MYYIINKTTKTSITKEGDFPSEYLQDRLNEGDDIIVISLYSNTIKIPYTDPWIKDEFLWKSFPIPEVEKI